MRELLFALMLLQVTPTGVVTGVVRSTDGKPASGVRVYAMAVPEGNNLGNTGTALESISQTDEAGRYRLEIPAGRYYIAAGSVEKPTYFPGTADIAGARVISITSAAVIDAIDFPGYVPATPMPMFGMAPPPGSTGELSGVIRYPDGSPAAGITVTLALPGMVQGQTGVTPAGGRVVSVFSTRSGAGGAFSFVVCGSFVFSFSVPTTGGPPPAPIPPPGCISTAQTDSSGRYRITNVTPGTYFIAAGYGNSPVYYPGTQDTAAATAITTTPSTNLDMLDFTMPASSKGTTLRGRVVAGESSPAAGATVELQGSRGGFQMGGLPMLPSYPNRQTTTGADGSFEIPGVLPGAYTVIARLLGVTSITRSLTVADEPVNDIDFAFPATMLLGQVLWEDGSPFPDAQSLREVVVETVPGSSRIGTTILPIGSSGNFSGVIDPGEYQAYVRLLPDEYAIKSMTAGTMDLLQGTLKVTGTSTFRVEVRMANRTTAGVKVSGRVVDSVTGQPLAAERLELCCLIDNPFERLSTRIQPDGSFEFSGVRPGRYSPDLQALPIRLLAEQSIEVGEQNVSGIVLASASQLVAISAQLNVEGGPLPASPRVTIVMTGSSGVPIPAEFRVDGSATVWVAAEDRYAVAITNVPAGYVVKSVMNDGRDLSDGGRLSIGTQPLQTGAPIVVTIGK